MLLYIMEVKNFIKSKRMNLSESSLITYSSILRNLFIKVYGSNEPMDLTKFNDDAEKTLLYLSDIPVNRRKTILSALSVICSSNVLYKEQMNKDVVTYNEFIKKQIKTPTQEKYSIEMNDIKIIFKNLENNYKLIARKMKYTKRDYQEMQNYIIIALMGGILIAPRRNLDYVHFKIKNIDKEVDNYYNLKDSLYFNKYKTSPTYGLQKIIINKELQLIIKRWIKINPTDYLFFDINNNPLSSVKLNQRLNKVFDSKISINNIRHSYLSEKFIDTIKLKSEISDTMRDMGSSENMLTTYVKH